MTRPALATAVVLGLLTGTALAGVERLMGWLIPMWLVPVLALPAAAVVLVLALVVVSVVTAGIAALAEGLGAERWGDGDTDIREDA